MGRLLDEEAVKQALYDAVDDISCGYYEVDGIREEDIEKIINSVPSAQPDRQNRRIFQEIIVEHPSISTYPEHEGKPYFSIKYMEDGQAYIGYGTYKPEVLSEYLKTYFISA